MWQFVEHFDRKIDAHRIGSLFWTLNNFWGRRQFFFDVVVFADSKSTLRVCKEKSHNIRCDPSVQTQKQAEYSAFWALTDLGHQYDYQWGSLLTKYLNCDVCASTLLPETLACTVSCKRSWSICTAKREATRVSWREVHVFSAWRRSLLLTPFQVQAWCLDTAPLRAMFASCEDSLG